MTTRGEGARALTPDSDSFSVVAFVSLLYLVATISENVLGTLFSLPFLAAFELVAALPVPLVLSMGPVALWGIPVGYVLSDVAGNAVGPSTLVGVGAHLYLGYSAGKLARWFDFDSNVSVSHLAQRAIFGRFLLVVGVAAAGGAAINGWGSEIVRRTPFFVAAPVAFVEYFSSTLLFAVPLIGLFSTVSSTTARKFDVTWPRSGELNGRFDLRRVVSVTLTWILLGVVGSVGYRTFQKPSPSSFAERNVEFVLLLDRPTLFGPGAGRLQVLLGAVLLSALLVIFTGPRYETEDLSK